SFLAEDYRLKNRRDAEGAEKRKKEVSVKIERVGSNQTQLDSTTDELSSVEQPTSPQTIPPQNQEVIPTRLEQTTDELSEAEQPISPQTIPPENQEVIPTQLEQTTDEFSSVEQPISPQTIPTITSFVQQEENQKENSPFDLKNNV
ncbi:MAG: hypothetical protein AAGJ08_27365, partial [Cyanobacteria bacterium P01_H01_bin.35]